MEATAADRGGKVVHVTRELAVAVRVVAAQRARFDHRVGTEEEPAAELDLVVGHVAERPERRVE